MTGHGERGYARGTYWAARSELLYYQYFHYFIRCLGPHAGSMVDVGSGNSPYLEWFDWIPERVSVDLTVPYRSETVQGIVGSILHIELPRRYDICSCMQVLEHIPDPEPFAHRLLEIADLLLVSVPYRWRKGLNKTHVNDPVDLASLTQWFGRAPNYSLVVREPFVRLTGARMFAIFDTLNPERKFTGAIRRQARPL